MKTLKQSSVSGLHPLVGYCYSENDTSFLLENERIENGLIEIILNPHRDITILVSGGSTSDIFYDGSWVRPFSRLVYPICRSLYSCACVGYSTSQELLRVLDCISLLKPDIIISLNGVNDFGLIQSPNNSFPYLHTYQNRIFKHIAQDKSFPLPNNEHLPIDLMFRHVASCPTFHLDDGFNSWVQNISLINYLSRYNNSTFYSFLEPCLGVPPLNVVPRSIEDYYLSKLSKRKEWYLSSMKQFYSKAVDFCSTSVFAHDFTSVLGGSPSNLFFDLRHLNHIGNFKLAKAVYGKIFE